MVMKDFEALIMCARPTIKYCLAARQWSVSNIRTVAT